MPDFTLVGIRDKGEKDGLVETGTQIIAGESLLWIRMKTASDKVSEERASALGNLVVLNGL